MNVLSNLNRCWLIVLMVLLNFSPSTTLACAQDSSSEKETTVGDLSQLPQIAGSWTIVHDGEGRFKSNGREITIAPATNTNLFLSPGGGFNVVNAPLLLFAPKGDFTFTVKLSALLKDAYDVGALVVYQDELHWAKLCFENSGHLEASVVSVVTRERSDDVNSEIVASPFVYLAIARKGDEFSMHFSRDGKQWRWCAISSSQLIPVSELALLRTQTKTRIFWSASPISLSVRPHPKICARLRKMTS